MTAFAPRTWLATLAGITCALATSAARAEQLDYQADPGCPDRGAFLTAAARKSSARAEGLMRAGPLKVQLRATPAGYTGVLERASGDVNGARVLSGPRCEDVAEALALTLALSLVPADEPAETVAAAAPPTVAPAGRAAFTVSAGLRMGGFVSGEPMLGPAVGVGLSRSGLDQRAVDFALEGSLRLSWARSDLARDPARARFELVAAALELCPLHAGVGRVRLGLCGLVEAGLVGGQGIDVAHPRWGRAAWLAVGGGLELDVALTRRWQVQAIGQAARPLHTTRFVFAEPSEPVARTASVAPSAAVALAARFP